MKIDFFTFIGPNSSDYAEYLKYTCEKFLSGKHIINWKCIESVGAEKLPREFKCVAKGPDLKHNSMSHGAALNLALDYVEEEYVVFVDADMAILYKNWDEVIVNKLNENDCFGVSYSHSTKYKNFPTVYLFAFRSYILEKTKLDFKPKLNPKNLESPMKIRMIEENAHYFNMKPASILKCDTGWKLPLQIKKAGFMKSESLPMVMMKSKKAQLPFENEKHKKLCMQKSEHMYEWHMDGKIFATHKQASRTQPINGIWGNAWKKRIDLFIKGSK